MRRSHPGGLGLVFLLAAGASVPDARGMDRWGDRGSLGLAAGRPRLALAFVDCAPLPAGLLAAVQDETAALVAAMGVEAEIRTLAPGADLDPDAITLILMNAAAPTHLKPGVMGAVQRQSAIPALWVFSANVASGARLAWDTRGRWSARDRDTFATAMARVAVHEVVHLVCPWRGHEPHGLMADVLDAATLTGTRLPFTRELRRDFALGVDALAGGVFPVAQGGSAARP